MSAPLRIPLDDVPPVAAFLDIAERSLRRQLEPGGDLERYAFRIGRRVKVKTALMLEELGALPHANSETGSSATEDPALATATTEWTGPDNDAHAGLKAVN